MQLRKIASVIALQDGDGEGGTAQDSNISVSAGHKSEALRALIMARERHAAATKGMSQNLSEQS